jgi:hypothetical protein
VHKVSLDAYKKFCKALGLSEGSKEDCTKKISFVYCPHPKLVSGETAVQVCVEFEEGIQLASYTVWQVYQDYNSEFPGYWLRH